MTGIDFSVKSVLLGPLAAFTGNWVGQGFNTIFRPYGKERDTGCFPPSTKGQLNDAVLELNLTSETLSFSPNLGSICNRGFETQEDIFLNGVPYLQSINDVTMIPARNIHFEPGILALRSGDHQAEARRDAGTYRVHPPRHGHQCPGYVQERGRKACHRCCRYHSAVCLQFRKGSVSGCLVSKPDCHQSEHLPAPAKFGSLHRRWHDHAVHAE